MSIVDFYSQVDDDSIRFVTAEADMSMADVETVIGDRYEIHLHTGCRLVSDATGVGLWLIQLAVDGVVVDRFARVEEIGALSTTVDASVYFTATAADHNFVVHLTEVNQGCSIQLISAEDAKRTLVVKTTV